MIRQLFLLFVWLLSLFGCATSWRSLTASPQQSQQTAALWHTCPHRCCWPDGAILRCAGCRAGGVERFDYFRNVVAVPNASKTTLAWSFAAFGRSELWVALITFLYLDFLDATGTLFSMGACAAVAVWPVWWRQGHRSWLCILVDGSRGFLPTHHSVRLCEQQLLGDPHHQGVDAALLALLLAFCLCVCSHDAQPEDSRVRQRQGQDLSPPALCLLRGRHRK